MKNPQPFQSTIIFTDGACSGNPGRGGWGAIIVRQTGHVIELGDFAPATTNNRMELAGPIHALKSLGNEPGPVIMYTDSTLVIRGITQWIHGWRKRDWKTAENKDVLNQDLWEALDAACRAAKQKGQLLEWQYIRGHQGTPGNERVDQIAVAYSKQIKPELYQGPLSGYGVPIFDLPEPEPLPEMKAAKPKQAAHSYLSIVDGKAMRHSTWADCERRVKGVSGARFKKALSAQEEAEILRGWGATLKD